MFLCFDYDDDKMRMINATEGLHVKEKTSLYFQQAGIIVTCKSSLFSADDQVLLFRIK